MPLLFPVQVIPLADLLRRERRFLWWSQWSMSVRSGLQLGKGSDARI